MRDYGHDCKFLQALKCRALLIGSRLMYGGGLHLRPQLLKHDCKLNCEKDSGLKSASPACAEDDPEVLHLLT